MRGQSLFGASDRKIFGVVILNDRSKGCIIKPVFILQVSERFVIERFFIVIFLPASIDGYLYHGSSLKNSFASYTALVPFIPRAAFCPKTDLRR